MSIDILKEKCHAAYLEYIYGWDSVEHCIEPQKAKIYKEAVNEYLSALKAAGPTAIKDYYDSNDLIKQIIAVTDRMTDHSERMETRRRLIGI